MKDSSLPIKQLLTLSVINIPPIPFDKKFILKMLNPITVLNNLMFLALSFIIIPYSPFELIVFWAITEGIFPPSIILKVFSEITIPDNLFGRETSPSVFNPMIFEVITISLDLPLILIPLPLFPEITFLFNLINVA